MSSRSEQLVWGLPKFQVALRKGIAGRDQDPRWTEAGRINIERSLAAFSFASSLLTDRSLAPYASKHGAGAFVDRVLRSAVCSTISFLRPVLRHQLFSRRAPLRARGSCSCETKADKSQYYEKGSGYDHPMRISHRGEHLSVVLRNGGAMFCTART